MDNEKESENKVSLKTTLNIIAIALVAFSGIMAETSMNVTFPILSKYFGTTLNNIQWVTTIYLLSVTIMITTSSYLVKRFNTRKLWITSVASFIIGTLIGGFAPNLALLFFGRILEGIAAGIAMPLVFNTVSYTIPNSRIGAWMGMATMVISIAPSLGPTYGGILVSLLGWRAIFFILLIAPIGSLILGWKNVININHHPTNKSFNIIGFILLALFLTTLLISVNQLASGTINWILPIITIVVLISFILQSHFSSGELLNLKLFKELNFVVLLIPIGLYMFTMLGINLIIPTFIQNVLHLSSLLAGFALLPGSLIGSFSNSIYGRMYDKNGPKLPLYLGNIIFIIAVLMMAIFTKHLNLVSIIILYIVFIIGRNMAFTNTQTSAINDQEGSGKAEVTAIIQTVQMFMGALGTTFGALFQSKFGMTNGYKDYAWLGIIFSIIIFGLYYLYLHNKEKINNTNR